MTQTSLNITSTLILKQAGYTFFVGFHGDKTYNTFVCGNTICSYMVFPQSHKQKYYIASTKLTPQTGYEKLFRTLSKLQIKRLGSVISLA